MSGTVVYGKIESGKPIIVSKRSIAFIAVLALSGSLAVPATIAAQQLVAANSDPTTLPEAPTPQLPATYSSSLADLTDVQQPQQASTPAPQQTPDAQSQTPEDRHAQAARELKQEESQRMLGILPAFNSVIGGHAEPLTPGQKFSLFFKSITDPYQFAVVAVDTGLQEAEDSYPGYHHGIPGLLRNYGAAYADDFDGNLFGNAILPSLLHQDPRYFRLGHGTFTHRLLYSVSTTVMCKGDNGKWQPNYSNVIGNLIGGAISNAYYPAADRGVDLTIDRGLTVTAEGAVGALILEFYPDFAEHMKHRKERKAAAAAASTPTPQP
jgi:hypothetical protein